MGGEISKNYLIMAGEREKLEYFLNRLKNEDFSLLDLGKLEENLKEKIPNLGEQEWYMGLSEGEQELTERLLQRFFYKKLTVYESCINRWDKGLWFPNEEELKKLKGYQKVFEEKILSQYARLKSETPSIDSKIEEEENISKERKKTLDKLLKNDEYRQKAEDLLKKYKDNPPFSGSNSDKDIETQLNEQITNLQNQIRDLENRQNQDSNLERDHKYKQELERLKRELEELKNKKNDKSHNREQGKKNDFPTGLVVGGGIAIVFFLLLVIIFLARKNSK